jgi:hypothetical protein
VSEESTLNGRDLFLSAAQTLQDQEGIGAEALVETAEKLCAIEHCDLTQLKRRQIGWLLTRCVAIVKDNQSRSAMHFSPPAVAEMQDGWRVAWRSALSGFEGHTGQVYNEAEALDLCERLNAAFPYVQHWAQSV